MRLPPHRTVYSDGACLRPQDPLLARAGWGVCVADERGRPGRTLAGPVDGPQTAQRAEVLAALAAVGSVEGALDLVSDSRYVVNGVAALNVSMLTCESVLRRTRGPAACVRDGRWRISIKLNTPDAASTRKTGSATPLRMQRRAPLRWPGARPMAWWQPGPRRWSSSSLCSGSWH